MITENISNLLSKINWDYNYSEKELLSLINKKNDFSNQRLSLYIKSLETFTWQELVSLWDLEECNNLYTDKIRKGLFSNKIREQYDGIFNLLRNKTLSYTKRSPEDLEKFKSTLLFNRRNRKKIDHNKNIEKEISEKSNNSIPSSLLIPADNEMDQTGLKALRQMQLISSLNGNSEMTLDEINAEIAKARKGH